MNSGRDTMTSSLANKVIHGSTRINQRRSVHPRQDPKMTNNNANHQAVFSFQIQM